mgnify:CR=1 FL=1
MARALFGDPFLVVLDEPNSNLDEAGEAALAQTIAKLKAMNKIVVVVAHRQDVLKQATHLCMIDKGVMTICGPKDAVRKRLGEKAGATTAKRKAPANSAVKVAPPQPAVSENNAELGRPYSDRSEKHASLLQPVSGGPAAGRPQHQPAVTQANTAYSSAENPFGNPYGNPYAQNGARTSLN